MRTIRSERKAGPAPRGLRRISEFAAFHARRRPEAVAVIRSGTAISYAQLHRDLQAMIRALDAFALPPGAVAAVAHDDFYLQLLMVFGFESLGVTTGSFRPNETEEAVALVADADLVLSPLPPPGPCRRAFEASAAWFARALASCGPALKPAPARPEEGEAIFRSSGTTGTPKRMLITHAMMRHRLRKQRDPELGLGLTARSRFMALMNFSVGSTYMAASNLLRLGGTFLFHTEPEADGPAAADKLLRRCQPTHLTLLPYQLRGLVNSLPERETPLLPGLTVQTIGAKLPDDLLAAAARKLAGRVIENYGTNEIGQIGISDGQGRIRLMPGTEVEVAGPEGAALPAGEIGTLRVRSPGLVTGYIGEPETTAAMFKDGWFYPGDLALLDERGRLRLVGRRIDVLNLGGNKMAAADLEARVLAGAPVLDVAMLQRNDGSASPPVVVCLVPMPGETMKTLQAAISPLMVFPFRMRLMRQIPRTAEGKIKRTELHDTLFPPPNATAA